MTGQRVPMSQETFSKLAKELSHLKKVERPHIIKEIQEARAQGDLSENAEYHAAREKQGHIEDRISMIEDKLARAEVIEVKVSEMDHIIFGATVEVMDKSSNKKIKYTLVDPDGVDLAGGKISSKSPIGKGLMGKKPGEVAVINTPKGTRELEILSFS